MSGHKIIEGLKEAIEGDMSRVTIAGQKWVRADALVADQQEIMRINNDLLEAVHLARGGFLLIAGGDMSMERMKLYAEEIADKLAESVPLQKTQ